MASADAGMMFGGLSDPALLEFIRSGGSSNISVERAMTNSAVYRSVTLISYAIGMLPLHLVDAQTKEKATDHPLFKLLHREPNGFQTAFNFRQLMQRWALTRGNAYAHIVRSRGRVVQLVPIHPDRVTPVQRPDWSVVYEVRSGRHGGGVSKLPPSEILHIFGDSDDGLSGVSLVKIAADAIGLAMDAERAARRLFQNGMMVGGALTHPSKLSPEAYERLRASMEDRYAGAENAHRWMVLEEGLKAEAFSQTSKDSQQNETRHYQIEDIGRIFGVPRPFLNLDDTSWGSGIDVLGQTFVRYALNPWFEAWQQAAERSLLAPAEKGRYAAKFNPGALLRGNMKDQADFFKAALGSGGHQPWMAYDEVRDTTDLPVREIAPNPLAQKGTSNEPAEPAGN